SLAHLKDELLFISTTGVKSDDGIAKVELWEPVIKTKKIYKFLVWVILLLGIIYLVMFVKYSVPYLINYFRLVFLNI
ncbi:MAG: hypothetical protein KAR20_04975, partial [Candidatus Heimdallarchaeota archaeon]|nr:hypothetical protein [Candidatus Heimdallarchaeota archaeon]